MKKRYRVIETKYYIRMYIYIEFEIYDICDRMHVMLKNIIHIHLITSKIQIYNIFCQKSSVNIDYRFGQCIKCYIL